MLGKLLHLNGLSDQRALMMGLMGQLTIGPVDSAPSSLFQFRASEFSLSFSALGLPKVRWLAEVTSRGPVDQHGLRQAQQLIRNIFERLGTEFQSSYDLELAESIFRCAYYPLPNRSGRLRNFRFGVAIEAVPHSTPAVKCYYDLNTTGPQHSGERQLAIFDLLGFRDQMIAYEHLNRDHGDRLYCRGLGVDFSIGCQRNARLYLAGDRFNLIQLRPLVERLGGPEHRGSLDLFSQFVLSKPNQEASLRSVIIGLVFAGQLPAERPVVKVDAFLPDLKADDQEAYTAISCLASALGIDVTQYADCLAELTEGRRLESLQNHQQYLSIDFLPESDAKLNVYVRPRGLETEHMPPRVRPRLKPAILKAIDDAIRAATAYLDRERLTGYSESTHTMIFPGSAGFTGESEVHHGIVFQIAVICGALLDAATAGFHVNWAGIQEDIQRIVKLKASDVRGGWKYFPSLPELPPDADDLGQVIQVMVRSEYAHLSEICDDSIALLLDQGHHEDGSLETWIWDRTSDSPEVLRIAEAIRTKWGDSPDREVMANVLYALHLYDGRRYRAAIHAGMEYILAGQAPEGYWTSSWYWGKLYGTYACTRLINAVQPNHPSCAKVGSFLRATQHHDGGWGDAWSTCGETALGLLTASEIGLTGALGHEAFIKGVGAIVSNQQPDGRWPRQMFIKMPIGRVAGSMSDLGAAISHGSDAMTTAHCLRALCASRAGIIDLASQGVAVDENG